MQTVLLDMEKMGPRTDAYAFAIQYHFARAHLHMSEHLYGGAVPSSAIMTVIPVTSQRSTFTLDTGIFCIPADLARESEVTYR